MGPQRRRLRHLRSIEGLRAVAVSAVVAYHAGATWLPGGFLGVDVFFVVSGYLIAAGLLQEWDATGELDVRGFWWRRARRLLPALGFLLVGTAVAALLTAPDAIPRLRGDTVAALTYTSNWWQIVAGQSYFEALGRSPLLRHLWSLAVEEQFYLAFPLALGGAVRRVRSRATLVLGAVGVAVASTVWMAVLWSPGDDPSRVYFGSDTRLAGLLVGVAVALLLGGRSLRTLPVRVAQASTVAGGAGLLALGLRVGDTSPWLYDGGGFLVVAVAAALLLVGTAHRRSIVGRVLGCRPMRWIGTRSYAIYLWHWPVQELSRAGVDVPWSGAGLVVARLVAVGVLAEMSWRFVEQPVRAGHLRTWWTARTPVRRRFDPAVAGGLAMLLAVPMLTASGPERQWWEAESQVVSAAGTTFAIDPAADDPGLIGPVLVGPPAPLPPAPTTTTVAPPPEQPPSSEPATTAAPAPPRAPRAPRAPRPAPAATSTEAPAPTTPPPPPPPPSDLAVLAMGDSVMVAARSALLAEGGSGTRVDAVVGRQNDATLTALERYRDDGTLAVTKRLIIHIGTNGPLTQTQFDRLLRITAEVPDVVVVNVRVPKSWESQSNRVIAENIGVADRLRLADWHETSKTPGVLGSDGVHPTPSGAARLRPPGAGRATAAARARTDARADAHRSAATAAGGSRRHDDDGGAAARARAAGAERRLDRVEAAHDEHGDVVARRAVLELDGRRHDRVGQLLGGEVAGVGDEPGDAVVAEELAVAAGLGDAVGVEHQHVARDQLGRGLGHLRVVDHPEHRPCDADGVESACAAPAPQRQRVAARRHGDREPSVVPRSRDAQEGGRAELLGMVAQQDVVEPEQDVGGPVRPQRLRPHGVAGQRGHDRGGRALAADVAEHEPPRRAVDLEGVVEVAADLGPVARRPVPAADVEAGDRQQHRRKERRLQRPRRARWPAPRTPRPAAAPRAARARTSAARSRRTAPSGWRRARRRCSPSAPS